MNSLRGWILPVVFLTVSILLVMKGLELRSLGSDVDGSGMGVYFLFMEINDRVPEQIVPSYAMGFLIASFVTFLITVGLFLRTYLRPRRVQVFK
ncbi:hypothetical protein [Pseudalkalibacillus berkeleyi]|uniref:Uncharacterized protein n=1 Tax=Pseudalkalibacillus berkeleyi TaxID=1069813 RepID=A0ABS9GYY9_9BACL|nr:hypothetical protein [Pseudalkalibacillus berkeleyi]MCF6136600.1 hypothetical protein [Pseudalkalibacillus berkeleyi]